jgi:hypothetical protein
MTPTAPIALFVYNRLQHVRQTVDAVRNNELADQSDLFVFSDGAKSAEPSGAVQAVRDYIRTITGFRSVQVVMRPRNMGLAGSIIDGVTSICNRFGRVIVLEDDLVTSPWFLSYMNQALAVYEQDERVASIHGYCYPVDRVTLPATFFLRGADCWGWATWSRSWRHFEADGRKLLELLRDRQLESQFDLDGAFAFTRMLAGQSEGKNDSWAVRWHAACFLREMFTLYPGRSLVQNIGNDASGRHCGATDDYSTAVADQAVRVEPIEVAECEYARAAFAEFLRGTRKGMLQRAFSRIRKRMATLP